MKLRLQNIGLIRDAEIALDGITVIAGENDTGKSTFGKALYSVFNGLYQVRETAQKYREKNIRFALRMNYLEGTPNRFSDRESMLVDDTAEKILHLAEENNAISENLIWDLLIQQDAKWIISEEQKPKIAQRIQEVLSISDDEFLAARVSQIVSREFNEKVCNIYAPGNSTIELTVKENAITVNIDHNEVTDVKQSISLDRKAVYIDDPLIIDNLSHSIIRRYFGDDHKVYLLNKLSATSADSNGSDLIAEILTKKQVKTLFENIFRMCEGSISTDSNGDWVYRKPGEDQSLPVRNLSTGLKAFVIMKRLLLNGTLDYNGTIILDEPEIHLHPEWQLLFAELIVLLQREYHMHILLNTHSPYFLRAIEVYAAKHGVAEKCHYYLTEREDNWAEVRDVTDNTEQIYKKLARPLQTLENLRWEDD